MNPIKNHFKHQERAFTLIELLITFAIIGILATTGVPLFRRMLLKSKQGEAFALLGGLKAAELGFYGEYGVFGNQILKLGFETDGQPNHYTIGFAINPGCRNQNFLPPSGAEISQTLSTKSPYYYQGSSVTRIKSKDDAPGCGTGTVDIGQYNPTPTYQFFSASASAALSPRNDPISSDTADGDYDIWMLGSGKDDEPHLNGTLFHFVDGLRTN